MPIYQTSTFSFTSGEQGSRIFLGEEEGYKYTRLGNPTTRVAEQRLAALEGSADCVMFSSGMGAIHATLFALLSAGDHVIADDTLYGCTFALLSRGFRRFGVDVEFCDVSKPGEVARRLRHTTRVVLIETPANPTLKIIDIARVAEEAHQPLPLPPGGSPLTDDMPRSGSSQYYLPRSESATGCGRPPRSRSTVLDEPRTQALLIVDNTFSSPVLTQPISLGADIVVHSATKFLGGHSDLLAGAVCASGDICARVLMGGLCVTGAVLSPHDAFLLTRGMMTLELRVMRCAENAQRVAEALAKHPAVERVNYPGLAEFAGHEVAAKQMRAFGALMSFEVRGGLESARTVLDNCRVFTQAVSLGGCESLVSHPATTTHAIVPREDRIQAGISDGLIRASCGIENVEDLISDLNNGLDIVAHRLPAAA